MSRFRSFRNYSPFPCTLPHGPEACHHSKSTHSWQLHRDTIWHELRLFPTQVPLMSLTTIYTWLESYIIAVMGFRLHLHFSYKTCRRHSSMLNSIYDSDRKPQTCVN